MPRSWIAKSSLAVLLMPLLAQGYQTPLQSNLDHQRAQWPFDQHRNRTGIHVFSSDGTLQISSLPSTEFTELSHPSFPAHKVRIKKSNFCDKTVNVYTGYIDFQARHLFFYFFESRKDPEHDPLMMWINGGPGASSSLGLFRQLGPCSVNENLETEWNPYSWNSNSSIFFLDQPVGVGFSYADYGLPVTTTEDAAVDVYAFISIFLDTFSSFRERPLHLAGESYAGRYLPVFASYIVDQNAKAIALGEKPIQLESILIGNGATNYMTLVESWYTQQCTSATVPPVQSISSCVRMKIALPRCLKMLRNECRDRNDALGCRNAAEFCSQELSVPYHATGRNPYDISKMCEGKLEETICYSTSTRIVKYLNQKAIRKELGVDPSITEFSTVAWNINRLFDQNLDLEHSTELYVAGLLERGIRFLIYAGTYDWVCNWIGNKAWTEQLEWTGKEAFNAEPLRDWSVDGTSERVGITRSANGLTFLTLDKAGHMAPQDKPAEALVMVNRWLNKQEF
ncbi:hypothetical protein FRC03_003519 [Tulasnella sp. 419]|nr:hypothetical protein FRC03_003519 [Tulasnella sp. 419]